MLLTHPFKLKLRVVRMFGRFVPKGWPLTFIVSRLACEARRAEENNKNGTRARSDQKSGKPACGGHLALLSTGGQSFGTKRPNILTNGTISCNLRVTTFCL